jgi:hypothetical protein
MKDIKQIQEFFSKSLEENTFKKGDKVTYLGHPAVVTATKEYNGRDFVSVSYDKGNGKTKASNILATSGDVKAINEELSPKDFPINFTYGGTTYVFDGIAKDRAVYYNPTMNGYRASFGSREEMDSFLDDYTSPKGGRQSTNLGEDINNPVLMKMRAAKDAIKNKKPDFGKEYGDAVKKARSGSNNDTKLRFLKKERDQLMRDMEQEAEPEGGPIANEYGSKLNRIDAAIAKLEGRKEMTYDQAIAEGFKDYLGYSSVEVSRPTQDQVDRFFALTQNETHYLNSKPVAGQEKTFNLMEG